MATVSMTQAQIIARLKTDPSFLIGFMIDNNKDGVNAVTFERYKYSATDPVALKKFILDKIANAPDSKSLTSDLLQVKYLNGPTESVATQPQVYTQGYQEYFLSQMAGVTNTSQKGLLEAVFAGVGAGLSTFADASQDQQNNTPGGTGLTQAQIDALKKEEEERKKKEEEEKRRRTTWTIVGVVVGLIVIGVVIYFAMPKKSS